MTTPENGLPPPTGPLDEQDLAVLDELRRWYAAADPLPAGLAERIRFAVSLDDLHAEVGRLTEIAPADLSVRGAGSTRSITFDGDSIAVVISISAAAGADVRVDGWVAPAGSYRAELRTEGHRLRTTSDEEGRFAFSRVASGMVQLLVEDTAPAQPGGAVITPAFVV